VQRYAFTFLSLFISAGIVFAQDPGREPDEQQAARQQYFYSQRAFPLSAIPAGARLGGLAQLNRLNQATRTGQPAPALRRMKSAALTTDSVNWTQIGPQPTGGSTTYATAGRINAIAIDPRDNNTVYIGAAEGGVWKTTDGGVNWTPLTDQQASLASGAIAIDPNNPDTVYVGTGEENFAGDSYYGAGILKSTDAGATWTQTLGPFLRDTIGALAIQPTNSNILLCAAATGLWRSTDAGATWTSVLAGAPATSLSFDPGDPSGVYAALGNSGGGSRNGVYHSQDGGFTWQKISGGFPTANVGRISLALAPSQPGTIYAQVQDSSAAGFGRLLGLWKTLDSGATWKQLPVVNSSVWGTIQWYDIALAVSPVDANVVYSGGLLIQRSLDGGTTWTALPQTGANAQILHADQHVFAFTADATRLYIGNDGGAYTTTDITNATIRWAPLNSTLAITQFYPGMSVHPQNAALGLGGTQDNGSQRFTGGMSWDNVACGDGGYTSIDPSAPSIAYSTCQNITIGKTVNLSGTAAFVGAQYGIDQTDLVAFIPPFVMDPSDPQVSYFGTYRIWQSRDSAGLWSPVSPDLTGGLRGTLRAIAVAPSDPNTVYAGTNNGKLWTTAQMQNGAGATWKDISAGLPIRTITHIAVDPFNAATAYVTYSGFAGSTGLQGHVYKTADQGTTWTDISGNLPNLPVNDLVVDPDVPGTLYVATDAGVMVTSTGGTSWASLGNGLPRVVVLSLTLHRPSRILRAATHGRSAWDILVPLASDSLQPVITTISPNTANAGDPGFTLKLAGSRFTSSTVVKWNGQPRDTTFVDAAHLTVQIPDSDLALIGRASILAFDPAGGTSNMAEFPIGPAPQTSSSQFVSSANPYGGSALGQRSLGALYGTNLAPISVPAETPPLPFTLGGVTMFIGGNETPLLYVSPTVVLFQVPFLNVNVPTRVPLVIYQGTLATTVTVTVQPYSPGLFSMNSQGTGQGAILIAGTASVAAPAGAFPTSRPAHIGEYISIYCTGLGDVTPRPGLGSPSPANPLSTTLVKPVVTLGDVNAPVLFSGLVPGSAGLYVVNVQVPDGVATGDAVPVTLSIAGITANSVTVAIDIAPNAQ
jgi:uncharacterized protein (TIGR03437 family)